MEDDKSTTHDSSGNDKRMVLNHFVFLKCKFTQILRQEENCEKEIVLKEREQEGKEDKV